MSTRTLNRVDVPDEHLRLMYEDGLSQYEIADAIGVSQKTVSRWLIRIGVRTRPKGFHPR